MTEEEAGRIVLERVGLLPDAKELQPTEHPPWRDDLSPIPHVSFDDIIAEQEALAAKAVSA